MKQELWLIRKQFRMTKQEYQLIEKYMKEQHISTFSEFLRNNLFKESKAEMGAKHWFTLWQSQKIEQISRDILQVTTLAEQNQQATSEHLRIILTCVQELMVEVEKSVPLSKNFRDKYIGGR